SSASAPHTLCFFLFKAPPTPATSTLSLHDALPISNTISPTTAGADSALDLAVQLKPRQRPLDQLKISLPAGLLAVVDGAPRCTRSEEHTSELQSRENLVCRLLLEKKKDKLELPATQ